MPPVGMGANPAGSVGVWCKGSGARAVAVVGEVRDRVVAIAGRPEVRPTVILSMPFDHRTLDGKQIADLLATLCSILESDELLNEVSHIPHIEAANPVLSPPVAMAEPLSTASVSAVG